MTDRVSDQQLTEAYEGGDGPDAVLFCHGFTSTPQSMRAWAEHLQGAGYTVSVPLLPGHGTSWQELNSTPWTAWYDAVDAALVRLAAAHERVFLAGLSMGGCLALRLAALHPDRVSGVVLVNPCVAVSNPLLPFLPVLRVLPSFPAIAGDIAKPGVVEVAYTRNPLRALYSQTKMWADTRARLGDVTAPLLIYRSAADHVIGNVSVPIITAGVGSREVIVEVLTRSYHVATLDYDAELIFDGSVEFFATSGRSRQG